MCAVYVNYTLTKNKTWRGHFQKIQIQLTILSPGRHAVWNAHILLTGMQNDTASL